MDPTYVLRCMLSVHVKRLAFEVGKDSKTAFRIAVALGKEEVKAFPKEWKPKTLKVGDVLINKVYLGEDSKIPMDYHAGWSIVTDISKTGKNITVQNIMSDFIYVNNNIIRIKPIRAVEIFMHRGRFKHFEQTHTIRKIKTLQGQLFFDTTQKGVRQTYETVSDNQWDSEGFVAVNVKWTGMAA